MGSYQRFSDENYKNWLKAAESLYILRSNIRDFVEKETETYHSSLRETLRGLICVKGCRKVNRDGKSPLCEKCERWKEEILQSRAGKGTGVHWDNVEPHRWPTEKWEVAKVYMPRGQSGHRCFEEFDIAAILNFMAHCKHFKKFHQGQLMTKVITLRNTVMHSPEFRLNKEKMNSGRNNVLLLAKLLETCIPKLHETISEEIKQFDTVLENYPGQASQVDVKKENLKLLDREQQALKEKIEFLAQRYEADQQIEIKDELQGMKNFLDQNKDLLESLKPQVNRLNEIQETVEKHEFQIDNLNNRVENLEKVTHDPMFTDDPLKFKNHLIEQARKRKWPEPLFTEELEASGYRGRVVVNERTFTGLQVCNNKRRAHQEVAKIALENLKSEFENTEEPSTCASLISSTSSTSNLFYGTVTVVLSKEVCSDGFVKEDEAVESSYTKLARQFGLNVPGTDNTFRTAVLEHLAKHGIQPPLEITSQQDDKNVCKLHFTFYDKDGSTTKRKAEQQAAKVALQQLSGFFNCSSDDVPDENYKGFLKERLDALGMANPVYETEQKKPPEDAEISSTSRDAEHISSTQPTHDQENTSLQPKDSLAVVQPPTTAPSDCAAVGLKTEARDSSPAPIPREVILEDRTGNLFYGTVTVVLSKEVCSDGFVKEDEAVESSYTKLARQFGLNVPGTDNTFRTAVLEHLAKHGIQPPLEITSQQDDKNVCKLHFTFYDKDGSTTKRKAEQQAAKVALQQLSGFFNCSSDDVPDENYKGFLKERLDALGMANPVYETEQKKPPEDARTSSTSRHAEHISVTQTQKHGKEKDSVAVVQPPPTKPSDCTIRPTTETRDSNPSLISREVDLEDHTEIKFLLALYHLKPPSVTVVRVCTNQNFSLTMNINLEKFTFKNSNVYTSKKDAIRKTYYLLGRALRVFQQDTDESKATMLVKQDFSQKSLTHPKEDIKGDKNFCCSLTEITYSLVCNGQGSSEAEAKQDALQKALCTLPLLFGHEALPASSSTEETEFQINTLLRNACQKDLTFSLKPNQHKISVDLQFKDFIMASKSQRTKKENRNLLSKRILGLLGEETESDCPSLRNCLDDWFKQRNLQQPVFEEMDEAQGSKATFSVELSCRHPDWEDSLEKAKENLVQELEKRFKYLIDQSKQD
ncbi:hypothetical protein AOLI_G00239920 [Acnodon oligacanthus]